MDSKTMRIALSLLMAAAFGFAHAQSGAPAAGNATPEELRARVLKAAASFKGVPYKYGAESPAAFDCSGYVRFVYRQATGMVLPRSARGFMAVGAALSLSAAQPGDIVVFNTSGSGASHVALYLGGNRVIHAVSDGPKTGVIESALSERYWGSRVISVRSVLTAAPAAPPAPGATTAPASPTPPASAPAPAAVTAPASPPAPAASPAQAALPAPEESIVYIALDIQARKQILSDPIPTEPGTSIAFAVGNATGGAGDFIVQFYVIDAKTYVLLEIHREKVHLAPGAVFELPAYRFDKPGKYKLAVKGSWGTLLLERSFEVVAGR